MEDKKYYIKPTSLMSIVYKIESVIPLIVVILIWYQLKALNLGIDSILKVFLPMVFIIIIVSIVFMLFVFDRFHYLKLSDNGIRYYRLIPTVIWDYKKIKSIKISKDTLINIEWNYTIGLPVPNKFSYLYKLYDIDNFIKDISHRYKTYTGKNLEIIME